MAIEIKVPALGESVSEATVAKWLKQVGQAVKIDEALVELETDKVTMEVNAPAAGVLTQILAEAGANVAVGALLGVLDADATASVSAAAPAPAPAPAAAPAPTAAPVAAAGTVGATQAGPAARKLAGEEGVDLTAIPATGKGGAVVTKGDVQAALAARAAGQAILSPAQAAAAAAPKPLPPRTPDPREQAVKMTRLRQRIAQRLKEAQNTAAILTTFNEVDMSAAMALRTQYNETFEKKHGVKLGFMSIFTKACVAALKELPAVNGEIYGDQIIYKNYYDIGIAVGTEQGLVVPVLRDADQLSFAEIEKSIAGLGKKARDGKLSMDELTGGTFSITNGGIYGSLLSTPILNPPQSGILGMHKIQKRPVVVSGKGGDVIEIRPMMYLALSYDHRIIDGKEAVTFLVRVKEAIEDPQRLLFDI